MEVKKYEEPREAAVSSVAVAASAPDKPRLCKVLGVDVGEQFKVRVGEERTDLMGPFWIASAGGIMDRDNCEPVDVLCALVEAINHPAKIERLPRLTPEEVQRCKVFGAKWVSRDEGSSQVLLWEDRPELKHTGVWDGEKSCAQTWDRLFPSVQSGQLIQVEDGT